MRLAWLRWMLGVAATMPGDLPALQDPNRLGSRSRSVHGAPNLHRTLSPVPVIPDARGVCIIDTPKTASFVTQRIRSGASYYSP